MLRKLARTRIALGLPPSRFHTQRSLARQRSRTHASIQGATSELITVALSASIGAPIDRVWCALTDPSERIVWDERILGEVSPSGRSTKTTKTTNTRSAAQSANVAPKKTIWRFRLGGVPLVMQDVTSNVDPNERLVSRISIGSMHFDQTLTFHREDDESGCLTPD